MVFSNQSIFNSRTFIDMKRFLCLICLVSIVGLSKAETYLGFTMSTGTLSPLESMQVLLIKDHLFISTGIYEVNNNQKTNFTGEVGFNLDLCERISMIPIIGTSKVTHPKIKENNVYGGVAFNLKTLKKCDYALGLIFKVTTHGISTGVALHL